MIAQLIATTPHDEPAPLPLLDSVINSVAGLWQHTSHLYHASLSSRTCPTAELCHPTCHAIYDPWHLCQALTYASPRAHSGAWGTNCDRKVRRWAALLDPGKAKIRLPTVSASFCNSQEDIVLLRLAFVSSCCRWKSALPFLNWWYVTTKAC